MLKSRRFPIWLTRRSYFKRIERWAKPGRAQKAAPEVRDAAPVMLVSNVVPFPIRLGQTGRPAFAGLRGAGLG